MRTSSLFFKQTQPVPATDVLKRASVALNDDLSSPISRTLELRKLATDLHPEANNNCD